MARPGVTYEQVSAAADSLVARSERPTLKAVRTELGGTGSPNTIHKHLKRWEELHRQAKAVEEGLPATVQSTILEEIHRRTAEARAELEQKLADAESAAELLSGQNEELERETDLATLRIRELEEALAKEKGRREKAEQEVRETREEAEREIQGAREQARQEMEAAEKARIEAAQARLQAEGYQTSSAELQKENKELRQHLKTAEKQLAEADKRAELAEANSGHAKAAAEKLETAAKESKEEIWTLRQTLHTTEKQLAETDKKASMAEAQSSHLQERIQRIEKESKKEIQSLRATEKQLTEKD